MLDLTTTIAVALITMQAQPTAGAEGAETKSNETAPTTEQTAKVEDDEEKIICRRTEIVGSKFKKKICGTKEQWETLANRGASTTREMQRKGKGLEPVN